VSYSVSASNCQEVVKVKLNETKASLKILASMLWVIKRNQLFISYFYCAFSSIDLTSTLRLSFSVSMDRIAYPTN
jgi:hypothetical protein